MVWGFGGVSILLPRLPLLLELRVQYRRHFEVLVLQTLGLYSPLPWPSGILGKKLPTCPASALETRQAFRCMQLPCATAGCS